MKQHNKEKGFTLLEAMIAILVLTIGIVAVLQIFPLALSIEKASQMRTQAIELAQEKIEEKTSKSYWDIPTGTSTEAELSSPFEDFSRETKVSFVDSDFQESPSDTGLKKIEVTVSWEFPLRIGEKQVKITTLITEK